MTARPTRRAVALAPLLGLVTACSPGSADAPGDATGATTPGGSPVPAGLPPVLAEAVRRAPQRAPRRATSPAEVVDQLVAASEAIDDERAAPAVLAAAGHLEQVAYRELGARPEWDGRVRALLPPRWLRRVGDNVASRREFIALQGGYRADTVPAWRIVAPLPAADLRAHYDEAEARYGVNWPYLAAINLLETGFGRIRGDSVAGAQGPMQFIPATWAQYGLGGDVQDPRDAILGAANYLSSRGFTRRGGRPDALYSYNNDDRYVRGVTRVAQVMGRDPRAFLGYHAWEVYYVTTAGEVRLPRGYDQPRPVDVRRWLAANPRA